MARMAADPKTQEVVGGTTIMNPMAEPPVGETVPTGRVVGLQCQMVLLRTELTICKK